jgi:RNA recognition motif-containing protein
MSVRLYVGNLPAEVDRQALEQIFNESGDSLSLKVITDRKTGKCRGFGFVTVESDEQATAVIEKFNGFDFNGCILKLEVALPRTGKEEPEEASESASDAPAPVRSVPKPALKSARTSIRTDVNLDTKPPKIEQNGDPESRGDRSDSSKRRSKNRKQSPQKTNVTLSYADTPDAHQPDPRWAQELAQLRQRFVDAQAVK